MRPSIFCGPFQPSLEDAFIERLKENPPGFGRRLAVVTPSRRLSDRVQRLVALERGLSLLNIRFHTFHSLALEVTERVGAAMPRLVTDDLFHDKVIDRILRKVRKDVRLPRGLSSACRSSLRDLMEANVDPAQFQEHFPDLLRDADQKTAFEFLLTVQQRYAADLARLDLMPMSGLERHAARLAEAGSAALEAYAEVIYYGFYDLNGAQAELFAAVAGARPTTVYFPYRKDHAAFRFVDRFYQLKLGALGAKITHLPARTETRGLGKALDALFEPARVGVTTDALEVLNVSGGRDEAWCAAKEILRLHERPKDPVAFGDIGIVARSLRDYRGALEAVLKEHGIPFSLQAPEPLMRHPAAKLSFLLLSLARRDFPASAVLDVVESPYFRMERFGKDVDDTRADWRRVIEHTGLHSGWLQWKAKVAPWAEKDLELFPHLAAEGRPGRQVAKERTKALWDFLQDLRQRLTAGETTWAERVARALELLDENFSLGKAAARGETEAFERVREAIKELEAFDLLEEQADGALFLETLEEKLNRESLDPPPAGRDCVRVLNAMDARGESFRVLFMIGLCEGVFPRQVREDPLLRDPLRALLEQPAGYWILPKMSGYDEEKLLFYHLAASASEKVYGIYARSDEDGKARVPSIYLRELCRATGTGLDGPVNRRVARQPLQKLDELEPRTLLSPKETTLLIARDKASPDAFLPAEEAERLTAGLARLDDLKREGEPHAMDGLLMGPPKAYLENLLKHGLSPTALDSFGTCPFKFYAGHVLRLKDPEEPRDMSELAPTLRGQIYHLIFQRFFERLREKGFWDRKGGGGGEAIWKPELEGVIDGTFQEFGWQGLGVYPVLWRSLKDQMSAHARRLAAYDMAELEQSGFVPTHFERSFQGPAPLGLAGALEGLRFRGKPDRVDVSADGKFRVVDYKSRWRRGDLEKIVPKGRAHQPPVYLEILSASPAFAKLEPAGAVYYAVEEAPEVTGIDWAHPFSAEFWRRSRAFLLKNMAGFVKQIAEGEFFIAPDDQRNGHCRWCAFSMSCRKSHARSRRRAELSAVRAAFDALRAGLKARPKDLFPAETPEQAPLGQLPAKPEKPLGGTHGP